MVTKHCREHRAAGRFGRRRRRLATRALAACFDRSGLQVADLRFGAGVSAEQASGRGELPGARRRLPGVSGLDFQTELAKASIHVPIIFITGHGDIPMTVRAMKAGAVEFLTKPFRDQDMLDAVATALERDRRRRESEKAVAELQTRFETLTAREREVMAFDRRADEQADRRRNRVSARSPSRFIAAT